MISMPSTITGIRENNHHKWSHAYQKEWDTFWLHEDNPTKEIVEKKLNELRKDKRWNGGF